MEWSHVECQGAVWETRNVLCRSFSHLERATRALEALMMSRIVTDRSKATQKLLMRFAA
jgi:hypothetical protein